MYKTYLHEVNQKKTATIFFKLICSLICLAIFLLCIFFIFLFLLILTLSQLSFSMSRNTLMSSGMAREG